MKWKDIQTLPYHLHSDDDGCDDDFENEEDTRKKIINIIKSIPLYAWQHEITFPRSFHADNVKNYHKFNFWGDFNQATQSFFTGSRDGQRESRISWRF